MAGTVTATQTGNTTGAGFLQVFVLDNAVVAGTPATAITYVPGTTAFSTSITTTQTGSFVFGAICEGNITTAPTPLGNTTIYSSYTDSGDTNQYSAFKTTTGTGTPGPTTVGSSSTGASAGAGIAAMEVLASGGTLSVDASTPASVGNATNVQATASFSPPAGSVLLAVVVTNGTASGAPTITMTGSGTLAGLTWTPGPDANAVTDGYYQAVGVWYATVPGGGAAASPHVLPYAGGQAYRRRQRKRRQMVFPAGPAASAMPSPAAVIAAAAFPAPAVSPLNAAVTAAAVTAAASLPAPAVSTGQPYITGLSSSGQYFVDQNGQPRLALFDNPWAIIFNAGEWSSGAWQTEMSNYLTARASQGFAAMYCSAIGNIDNGGSYLNGNTWDNVPPFVGGGPPSAGLNATYWARVDYFLNTALALGITVFLNIAYTADGTGNGTFDTGAALDTGALTTADYTDYGTALGNRYKTQPNLVWVYGNDYYATNETQFGLIRTAIVATGDTHNMSVHVFPESGSRYDMETGLGGGTNGSTFAGTYAQFNWVYTYNVTYWGIELAYEEAAYYTIAQLAAIWGDGYFYDSGSSLPTDQQLRQFAWWAVASGARGLNTGSNDIQKWDTGSISHVSVGVWYTTSAGAMRSAIEALPGWQTLMPDTASTLVTGGRGTHAAGIATGAAYTGSTDNYVAASRSPDTGSGSSLAIIYCAKAFSITINQAHMATGYTATWLDPVNGATSTATVGSTYNSGTAKGNNAAGEPDWVLILQGPTSSNATATPGAVTATASVPSVTVSTGETVSAAAAAGTAAFPAAAASGNAAISAAALTVTTTVPAAAASGGAGVSPSALAVTSAQPSVTVSTGETASPAVMAAAGSVPAPALSAGVTLSLPAVAASTAVPAATASGNAAITATAVAVTASVPSVTAAGGANPAPAAVAASASVAAVTIATGEGAAPSAVAATAAFPAPAASGNAAIAQAVLTVSTSVPAAVAAGGANPAPAAVAVTSAVPSVAVSTGQAASPAAVASAASLPAPAVTAGGSATIAPAAVTASASVPAPVVRQDRTIAAAVVTASTSVPAVSVATGETAAPGAVAATASVPAAVASGSVYIAQAALTVAASVPAAAAAGGANPAPSALAATSSVPATTVSTGETVSPPVLAVISSLPAPVVTAGGNATIAAGAVTASAALPVPVVRQDATVAAAAVAAPVTVPAPAVSCGAAASPATLTAAAAVPVTAVSSGTTVTVAALPAATSVPGPQASGGAGVSLAAVAVTVTVPAPSVSTATGASVAAVTVTALFTAPQPLVRQDRTVPAVAVSVTAAFPVPSVTAASGITGTVLWQVTAAPPRWHAGPAAPRWNAGAAPPRWQAGPAAPRWLATPASPRWKAVLMNFEPVAAISLEYLNMLWTADLAGTELDPTGQTAGQLQLSVLFAVPQSSGNPLEPAVPSVWYTAVWLLGGNIRGFVSQGLVGPSPAPVQFTAGLSYDVFGKIEGAPEVPVKFCGTVSAY